MAVPKLNEKLLRDLEEMGFPPAIATRALYFSGNTSLEEAINWTIDHENDRDIDEMPLVDVDIEIESSESFPITEEIRMKAHKLIREQELKRKEDEQKKLEREREKERIQAGKKLLEAKRIAEENERQRNLSLRKAEKEEEKRARERVLHKLEQDKMNRRSRQGLPPEGRAYEKSFIIAMKQDKNPKPVYYTTAKVEHLRECLRSLKLKYQGEHGRVKKAFETLVIYVGNVVKNSKEEKYRKIRLSNPLFQERVGSLTRGIEFLELCGFERTNDFLYLPHEKVDLKLLNSAGTVLNSAMTNPFFGLLST